MVDEVSLKEYLKLVDSDSPTPGGGSVCAYVTSLGIGLARMAMSISAKRKAYSLLDTKTIEEINLAMKRLLDLENQALTYVQADIDAFNLYMSAYRAKDETAIRYATITCFNSPYQLGLIVLEAIDKTTKLAKYVTKSVWSDLEMSLTLSKACLESCKSNMKINLSNIMNETNLVDSYKTYEKDCEEAVNLIEKVIKGGNE